MKQWLGRSALLALGLAAAGLSYVRAHPFRRTAPRLDAGEARALLAAALEPLQQPSALRGKASRPVLLISDPDRVQGLRFELREVLGLLVAIFTPLASDWRNDSPASAPVVPVHALLRHERFGKTTDYPMTQVGPQWVAALPRNQLSILPGDGIYAGAWMPGADISDPTEAAYWTRWNL